MTDIKGNRWRSRLLHIIVEFIIAAFVGVIASFIQFPTAWYSFGIAFVAAFAVGVFKESMNVHNTGHHFSLLDLLLDFIGCLLGASCSLISNYFTWHIIPGVLL